MPGGGEVAMLLRSARGASAVIKLGEMIMILDLHRQGLSVSAIARESGFDCKTDRWQDEAMRELQGLGQEFDAI